MTNQEQWIDFCARHTQDICLYDQPFWLDAVCEGRENWDVLLTEEHGEIIAALPFHHKQRLGLTYVTMPKLTQRNQIWIQHAQDESTEEHIVRENQSYSQLIKQIETMDISVYQQCLSQSDAYSQPFDKMGYNQSTLYTFCVDSPYDLDGAFRNFAKSTKQAIKRAGQAAEITEFDDIDLFYKLNTMTFERQHMRNPVSRELIVRLYNACKEHNAVKMLCAKDAFGTICDVLFLVYDAKAVYSLMSGSRPDKRGNNFMTALDYEGIKFACDTGRLYDFEGSMMEGVANYNRAFGAEMRPYYSVKKVLEKRPVIRQYLKYILYA